MKHSDTTTKKLLTISALFLSLCCLGTPTVKIIESIQITEHAIATLQQLKGVK